jgi:hypothetical protein
MYVVAWKVNDEELFVRHADSKEIMGFETREQAQGIIEKLERRVNVDDYFYVVELKPVRH